jgi:hypothetical protein
MNKSKEFENKVLKEMYDNIVDTCNNTGLVPIELSYMEIDFQEILEDKSLLLAPWECAFPLDLTCFWSRLREKEDLQLIQDDLLNLDIYEDRELLESFGHRAILRTMSNVSEIYHKMYNSYFYEHLEEFIQEELGLEKEVNKLCEEFLK